MYIYIYICILHNDAISIMFAFLPPLLMPAVFGSPPKVFPAYIVYYRRVS